MAVTRTPSRASATKRLGFYGSANPLLSGRGSGRSCRNSTRRHHAFRSSHSDPRRRWSAQRQAVEARPRAQPQELFGRLPATKFGSRGNISRKLTPSQGVSGRCSCGGTRFTTLAIGTAGPVAGETCRARVGIDVPCPARPCAGVSFFRSRSWTRTAQPFIRVCHSFTVMVIAVCRRARC